MNINRQVSGTDPNTPYKGSGRHNNHPDNANDYAMNRQNDP